jgi:hypothetical protein
MKLSKAGYGSITEIKNLDSNSFMNLIFYENYLVDYQNAVTNLSRK